MTEGGVDNGGGCDTRIGVLFTGMGMVELDGFDGSGVGEGAATVCWGETEGDADNCGNSICELLTGGEETGADVFEATMLGAVDTGT